MSEENRSFGMGLLYPKVYSALRVFAVGACLAVLGNVLYFGANAVGNVGIGLRTPVSGVSLTDVFSKQDEIVDIDSERVMAHFAEAAPSSFETEVIDEQGDWCFVDEQGVIMGFANVGDEEKVMRRIDSALEENGWKSVPSGRASVATFVKGSGEYRWAVVSLSFFGEEASVTINARRNHVEGE